MRDSFFLHVSSSDSLELFPDNTAIDFRVQLPRPLNFETERWVCKVPRAFIKVIFSDVAPISIHSDFCEQSYIGDSYKGVLTEFLLRKKTGWQQIDFISDIEVDVQRKDSRFLHFKVHCPLLTRLEVTKLVLYFERLY